MKKDYKFRFLEITNLDQSSIENQPNKPYSNVKSVMQNNQLSTGKQYAYSQSKGSGSANRNLQFQDQKQLSVNQFKHQQQIIKNSKSTRNSEARKLVSNVKIESIKFKQQQNENEEVFEYEMIRKVDTILKKHIKLRLQYSWKLLNQKLLNERKIAMLFTNHCVTLIQKHFRRYIQQKYYKKIMPIIARMKQLINAVSEGWKLRRIFKTKVISKMISEIKKKQQEKKFRDMRIQKRELAKQINKMMKSNKWISEFKNKKNERRKVQKISLQNSLTKSASIQEHKITEVHKHKQQKQQEQIAIRFNDNRQENYDEKPLKPANKNIYTEFPDDIIPQEQQIKVPKPKKVIKLQDKKKNTKQSVQKKQEATSNNIVTEKLEEKKVSAQKKKQTKNSSKNQTKLPVQEQPQKQVKIQNIENQNQGNNSEQDEKKKFLKKRVKYDPRKAIQQEKERKQQMKNNPVEEQSTIIVPNPKHTKSKSPIVEKESLGPSKQISINIVNGSKSPISNIPPPKLTITNKELQKPKLKNLQSPTNTVQMKERHICINELESTYDGAYNTKKYQMKNQIQKLYRGSKKGNSKITSIKINSGIYKMFNIENFYKMDSILQRRCQQMSKM